MIPTWHESRKSRIAAAWPVWAAIAALWILTYTEQWWVYSVLFLVWGIYDVATGESHFIRRVTREAQPFTFWLVVSTWILLSLMWVAYPS
jgi:hypothetical protein